MVVVKGLEDGGEDTLGDVGVSLDGMDAILQDLGLDDGDETVDLADGGITGEVVGGLLNGELRRHLLSSVDLQDGSPLGETSTLGIVLLATLIEAIKTHGGGLTIGTGEDGESLIDLDTGDDALLLQKLDHLDTLGVLLEEGLLVEDGTRDVLTEFRGGEKERPVGGTVLNSVLDTGGIETLLDGASGLIGGQDTLVGGADSIGWRWR